MLLDKLFIYTIRKFIQTPNFYVSSSNVCCRNGRGNQVCGSLSLLLWLPLNLYKHGCGCGSRFGEQLAFLSAQSSHPVLDSHLQFFSMKTNCV